MKQIKLILCVLLMAGCADKPTPDPTWPMNQRRYWIQFSWDADGHPYCYKVNAKGQPCDIFGDALKGRK